MLVWIYQTSFELDEHQKTLGRLRQVGITYNDNLFLSYFLTTPVFSVKHAK